MSRGEILMPIQPSSKRGEVLVAIMNDPADFAIAQEHHWYRIPVKSAPKRWPPQWLAFYQTKDFSEEKYSVKYFARVNEIRIVSRQQLFPDEPKNKKSSRDYYQLLLEPLQSLPIPIVSRKWRRIVFIPTTWEKFLQAREINDLYDESPLEDRLWTELKQRGFFAERQYYLKIENQFYCLDFAFFCRDGKLNIETDGDMWHSSRDRIAKDNRRDNYITIAGWYILRFNSKQVNDRLLKHCIPVIEKALKQFGGLVQAPISETPVRDKLDHNQSIQEELFDKHFEQEPEEIFLRSRKGNLSTRAKSGKSKRKKNLLNKLRQVELFDDMPKPSQRMRRRSTKMFGK
jgi:very-short-patch-repair endonuclease